MRHKLAVDDPSGFPLGDCSAVIGFDFAYVHERYARIVSCIKGSTDGNGV